MTALQIIFYIFSATAIFSSLMVIVSNNSVRSVLFLVLTFFAMGGIWMLLQAEFLALVLVLVYVGAVMTLFLFVVMMLSLNLVALRRSFVRYLPLGVLVILLMVGLTMRVVGPEHFGLNQMAAPPLKLAEYSNLTELGNVLYTTFAYPFEIAAVLLLTAIVAAISLTHRKAMKRKVQDPEAQMAVRREDRVRLVKMPAEKRNK